jgi:hypothetical protein
MKGKRTNRAERLEAPRCTAGCATLTAGPLTCTAARGRKRKVGGSTPLLATGLLPHYRRSTGVLQLVMTLMSGHPPKPARTGPGSLLPARCRSIQRSLNRPCRTCSQLDAIRALPAMNLQSLLKVREPTLLPFHRLTPCGYPDHAPVP